MTMLHYALATVVVVVVVFVMIGAQNDARNC